MTIYKALHPKVGVDRIYVSRKERRGPSGIEDIVDTLTQRLEGSIRNFEEDWLQIPETIQTTQGST